MAYIEKLNEEVFKEFIEIFLNKNLTFVKMKKQYIGVSISFCYDQNYSKLHNMMFYDYHVTSDCGVWVSKFWKAFMYEKFGEQYLKDFADFYLTDYKNAFKRQYKEFVEKIKAEYEEKENDIKREVKEIKSIINKKDKEK